ncbi:MAG: proteinase inhibitor i78 [Caulobacteraceae bacterium]
MRIWAVSGTMLILAACAGPQAEAPPTPSRGPPPPQSNMSRPPPPRVQEAPDSCGARPLQYLVGRPRTEIPIPLEPGRRRVVCSTCPMTQDYSAYRQTIIYDAQTGLVREVKCG